MHPDTTSNRERFLNIDQVCDQVGAGRTTVYEMVKKGDFPKPLKFSRRAVRWTESSVQAWIRTRIEKHAH